MFGREDTDAVAAFDLDRDLDTAAVRYGPRPTVPTKLDPFKAIIEARLATYPELSAVRLLMEIRAAGHHQRAERINRRYVIPGHAAPTGDVWSTISKSLILND